MPRLCSSLLLSLLIASSASAVTIDDAIDGLWQQFQFGVVGSFATACEICTPSYTGNSEYAGNPPWTFTAINPLLLTVTDVGTYGDEFEIFNFGASIGATSSVETPVVYGSGTCETDPEDCVSDPLASSGTFNLAPGAYSLTIQTIDFASSSGAGAAHFRLDTVPEPGTGILVIAGLLGLAVRRGASA